MKPYFILILLCSIVIISCQKNDELSPKDIQSITLDTNSNARTATSSDVKIDPPTVLEGRYSFRDFEHFTSLYQHLDQIYTEDNQRFNDFVSKNGKITSVHTLLHTDVFVDPQERYQPFLTDPIMMALVNEHFEFQIGQYLVTYMNNDKLLLSDATDKRVQHLIRAMEKGIELNIESIPEGALWADDTEKATFLGPCNCIIRIRKIDCNQFKVYGHCTNILGNTGKGTVSITIDLSPTVSETHDINGNFEFVYTIPDVLPSVDVVVKAKPKCPFGIGEKTIFYTFNSTLQCDPLDKDTGWLWNQDNGVQGLSHRTATYKTFWSTYEEATAFSKHWYNGIWYENYADLEVTINASRKWKGDCSDAGDDSATMTSYSKNENARVNTGFFYIDVLNYAHCDGGVQGTFKKTLNWNNMTWDINGFGDVDFECCE